MPRQWERSLSNIPRLTEPDEIWHRALERGAGDRLSDPKPPRRQRLVAGVVGMGVFLGAALFAWQTFESANSRRPIGEATEANVTRPTVATLTLARPTTDAPLFATPTAMLEFGDFVTQLKTTGTNFVRPFYTTSELPGSSVGLPVGLPLKIAGDAEAATVEIYASPYTGRNPIAAYDLAKESAALPDEPGTYYLVVRAEWTDGWASFLWGIPVLQPGTLQFMFDDHPRAAEAGADLWIDGLRVQGAIVRRTHTEGDSTDVSTYPAVDFGEGAFLPVEAGAPVRVIGDPNKLSATLTGPAWADTSTTGSRVSLFGPHAQIPAEPGRHLLVVDASWEVGAIGPSGNGFRDEVRLAFPVLVGSNSVPSPGPPSSGPIVVTFDTSEKGKIPRALATFGGRMYPAVMNSYRFTIDGEVFTSLNQYRDAAMIGAATIPIPPRTTIVFVGNQDRVLIGWGGGELVQASSPSAQGSPGDEVVLRFRAEWQSDSFVEWELYLGIQAPSNP